MLTCPASANASVTPSTGLILVYSGILRHVVANSDELAAILGHELAHVIANHSKSRMSTNIVASIVSLPFIVPLLLTLVYEPLIVFAAPLVPIAASVFYISRKQEKEADYIGMLLMADAGFDPSAAVNVWKKFKERDDYIFGSGLGLKKDSQWQSTHPLVRAHSTQLYLHM